MEHAVDATNGVQVIANSTYWFERELRQYTGAHMDYDALLRHGSKLIPAVGRASRGYPTCATGVELVKILSRRVLQLAGGRRSRAPSTRVADQGVGTRRAQLQRRRMQPK